MSMNSFISKFVSRISLVLVLVTAQLTPFFVFAPQASADENLYVICHATSSVVNPYSTLPSVAESAIDGVAGNSGNTSDHYGNHTGPLASSEAVAQALKDNHETWGDIIPPVPGIHGGLNWTPEGQAMLDNDCNYPKTTVQVTKYIKPSKGAPFFDLFIDGDKVINDAGDGYTSQPIEVDHTSNVVVMEKPGTSSGSLSDYNTSIVCTNQDNEQVAIGNPTGATQRQLTINASNIDKADQIICVFRNTQKPPTGTLVVHKTVNNDNGGTSDPSQFSFVINDGNPTAFEADGTNELELEADVYKVEEVVDERYITNTDNCTHAVVLAGETTHCYIVNTAKPGKIVVNKTVKDKLGDPDSPTGFSFKVNGGDSVFFEDDGTNEVEVVAGTYSVVEDPAPGYKTVYDDNCSDLVVGIGETVTCNILNTEVSNATLNIVKELIQDHGATDAITSFSFSVNGEPSIFFDDSGKVTLDVKPGTYNVVEDFAQGYEVTHSDNCSVVLEAGDEATCTITNDDYPAYLTLYKRVDNNFNGPLGPLDFPLTLEAEDGSFQYATSGLTIMLSAGKYNAGEKQQDGYVTSGWDWWKGGDCDWKGRITVTNGEKYECTITNHDLPGIIKVHKTVINNNGGRKKARDFKVKVDDGSWRNLNYFGTKTFLVDAGVHTVTEQESYRYRTSYKGCEKIHVKNGETKHCYITNDDRAPRIEIAKFTEPFNDEQAFNFTINSGDYSEQFTVDGRSFSGNGSNTYNTTKNFQAGKVTVDEEKLDNWEQSSIWCYERVGERLERLRMPFTAEVGANYYCEIYNIEHSTINVTKFHDYDEDGEWDEDEPTLEDWEMTLTREDMCVNQASEKAVDILKDYEMCDDYGLELSELTNGDGIAVFDGLYAGQYYVNEVLQEGWTQSVLYCDQNDVERVKLSNGEEHDGYPVRVWYGETVNCYVGNYRHPEVEIDKTNNTTGPVLRGTEVTFTLKVTVPGPDLSGALKGAMSGSEYLPVTVTDNLTDEFEYVPGSFTAMSSVRGDLVTLGVTTDPNYASPGTWLLTSLASNIMLPGEIVTLTYKAVVGATTPAGTYATVANVIGYGDTSTITATNKDDDEVAVYVPAVLGTSTTLAQTGQNYYQSMITGIVVAGAALSTRRRKENN